MVARSAAVSASIGWMALSQLVSPTSDFPCRKIAELM